MRQRRRRLTRRPYRFLVLAAALAAAITMGCTEASQPARPGDPDRLRLLGGLPPEEAARGVYVVDIAAAGEDLSPGSRLAPLVSGIIDEVDLLVETAAPPVTLLSGVPSDVTPPAEGVRVDDIVVIGEPQVRDAVAARLREGAQPEGVVAALAAVTAPVAWTGPTPDTQGVGTTTVTLDTEEVRFVVEGDIDAGAAATAVSDELATGGPPGSPGKPWRTIFGRPEVTVEDDRLVISAVPADLPGLFLRALLDQRQLTFLPG